MKLLNVLRRSRSLNYCGLRKWRFLCSTAAESDLSLRRDEDTSKEKASSEWKSVVGLEIHAQINAKSKLFSGSGTKFKEPTNMQVSFFDAALPGTLPVLNRYCVEACILTALALKCEIHKTSTFDRKHYFYSDLPAGYQITQQFQPIASNGCIDFVVYDQESKIKPYSCRVRLKQIQLEQDSGRSYHMASKKTLIDLNRAGIALMELVFEPDLKNGLEASMLVKELSLILTRLGTCSCAMEEGALRVDANISVHREGEPWGVRTEVKNINSYRYIAKAVDFEIERQIGILEAGGIISNETRSFDYASKSTVFMRDKEEFQDYRFMPEPNLPPIQLFDDGDEKTDELHNMINIDELRRKIPVLPAAQRHHLIETYKITFENADRIVKEDGLFEVFQSVTSPEFNQEEVISYLTSNVKHQLNSRKQSFENCEVNTSELKELIGLIQDKNISVATADDILEMLFNGDQRTPKQIVEKYNWFLITDEKELEKVCLQVMKERPKMVKKYASRKTKRYMTSLLDGLNEKVNNRAALDIAESVFIRLIKNRKKAPPQED